MTIDISTQQIAIILILGTIALIGSKYGDSKKRWLLIGGIASILLICYCAYLILNWALNMI